MQKLRRVNKEERRVFGVCGGISKFLDPDLDPVLIRIVWIVLTLFSPIMIFLYLALALALKVEKDPYVFDKEKYEKPSKDFMEVKIEGASIKIEEKEEGDSEEENQEKKDQ